MAFMEESLKKLPPFGPVLRELRKGKGMTQEQLSVLLEYDSPNYVSKLELGYKKPSVELLFKIALALQMRPSSIIAKMEKDWWRELT